MLRRERGVSALALVELDTMLAGLTAGGVSMLLAVIFSVIGGHGALLPFRLAASVLFHDTGMTTLPGAAALAVGLVVHLGISLVLGFFLGLIATDESGVTRGSWARQAGLGAAIGLGAYLIDIQLIARLWYPMFLGVSQVGMAFLHIVGFGLPLGLFAAMAEHRRPAFLPRPHTMRYRMPYSRVSSPPRRDT